MPIRMRPIQFEEFAQEHGITSWRARWLMERLGYTTWSAFRNVLNKAVASCMRVGCDVVENFRPTPYLVDGREEDDFKLSRFACFLVAQHADARKPAVEEVRTYLAGLATVMVSEQMLERLQERETASPPSHSPWRRTSRRSANRSKRPAAPS